MSTRPELAGPTAPPASRARLAALLLAGLVVAQPAPATAQSCGPTPTEARVRDYDVGAVRITYYKSVPTRDCAWEQQKVRWEVENVSGTELRVTWKVRYLLEGGGSHESQVELAVFLNTVARKAQKAAWRPFGENPPVEGDAPRIANIELAAVPEICYLREILRGPSRPDAGYLRCDSDQPRAAPSEERDATPVRPPAAAPITAPTGPPPPRVSTDDYLGGDGRDYSGPDAALVKALLRNAPKRRVQGVAGCSSCGYSFELTLPAATTRRERAVREAAEQAWAADMRFGAFRLDQQVRFHVDRMKRGVAEANSTCGTSGGAASAVFARILPCPQHR